MNIMFLPSCWHRHFKLLPSVWTFCKRIPAPKFILEAYTVGVGIRWGFWFLIIWRR